MHIDSQAQTVEPACHHGIRLVICCLNKFQPGHVNSCDVGSYVPYSERVVHAICQKMCSVWIQCHPCHTVPMTLKAKCNAFLSEIPNLHGLLLSYMSHGFLSVMPRWSREDVLAHLHNVLNPRGVNLIPLNAKTYRKDLILIL